MIGLIAAMSLYSTLRFLGVFSRSFDSLLLLCVWVARGFSRCHIWLVPVDPPPESMLTLIAGTEVLVFSVVIFSRASFSAGFAGSASSLFHVLFFGYLPRGYNTVPTAGSLMSVPRFCRVEGKGCFVCFRGWRLVFFVRGCMQHPRMHVPGPFCIAMESG